MTQLATPSDFKKDYLPGYTGHVPSKNERFGSTTGQIKREILVDAGKHPILLDSLRKLDQSKRLYSSSFVPHIDENVIMYGNLSRYAKNWINGPNHEIRNQYVPGYTGHIKGLISENLFASSYANTTAKAIGKKHPIGHDIEPKERFLSQNAQEYRAKKFRRFGKFNIFLLNNYLSADKPQMLPRKDYQDYSRFINDTYHNEKVNLLSQTIKNSEFSSGKSSIFHLKTTNQWTKHGLDKTQEIKKNGRNTSFMSDAERKIGTLFGDFEVKPKVLESKVSQREEFFNLSDGFKQSLTSDTHDLKLVIPIAGYGGHRRGERSQNFFGKSFRETSLQSKKLQRDLQSPVTFIKS